MSRRPIALLSVYNKDGIIEFATELIALGYDLISSGGTARALTEAELPVKDVAEISGLAACLGHRVVTLVPHIHGGLLALESMLEELEQLGYPWIDLVCVDLYPLKAEIENPEATRESVIEKTDIGGPTMVRSGAKGRRIVICDPKDRMPVIGWLKEGKPNEKEYVNALAAKADGIIAEYCLSSARYHSAGKIDGMIGTQVAVCKYGENAWQTPAGLYSTGSDDPLALDKFEIVAGQPPSFNNFRDIDRMLQTATHLTAAFSGLDLAIAVKHGNSCGASFRHKGLDCENILRDTIDGDKRAIFGGLMLTTFEIDELRADIILTHGMTESRRLLDGIVAPSFTSEAIKMLQRKGDKCRFLANPALASLGPDSLDTTRQLRQVRGGFLAQPNYTQVPDWGTLHDPNHESLCLAWAIGSTSNSNTITLVKNGMLIGNGVGQQDRVGCCELALKRARDAGHDPRDSVAYSDSFFPFPDGPKVLIEAGIKAILTTSGSVNDEKTRKVCGDAGVALYTLPDAEARGFFGH
ncbi:MAG: hypothetical protein WC787_02015 [Patescibacteria group bacterium]|jgi:phosphoribosylaminoimidazolecarboxamide formyltransferase/IMP cyclohydrolase